MAEGYTEVGNPTDETDAYWIFANNKSSQNNKKHEYDDDYEKTTKCGKWMIFEKVSVIDQVWQNIKTAVTQGRLGCSAKVSTMKDKGERRGRADECVICVYTYDWTDEADVQRVRKELREMGFERKLLYKCDAATLAGNYGRNASKYCY